MTISHWLDEKTSEESNDFLFGLCRLHASRISNTNLSVKLADLIDRRDIRGLAELEVDYLGLCALDAYEARQIRAFFEKRVDLDFGCDREAVAWEAFQQAERVCDETNTLLKAVRQGSVSMDPDFDAVMFTARRKIAYVLGGVPRLDELRPRFGPGASTQVKRRTASWKRKLSQVPACSEDLLPLARYCLEELQGWFFTGLYGGVEAASVWVDLEIHPGKLSFVPKSFKTHRSIVVEPQLNSMFQLGIGDYIGKRLRGVGVDIRDQSRNKSLAAAGSLTGDLATLDLSSASDTIAYELVAELLPLDWFSFLRYFRTSTVEYKGKRIKLAKFSSMGNGFTFPLETLIFWSLARAAVDLHPDGGEDKTVAVYGDDIIVPSACYSRVANVLRLAGFSVNTAKSYHTGPFRESCGGDYLSGTDIRPYYQKGRISPQTLFTLYNYYVRRYDSYAAELVLEAIPKHLVLWGPDGYGDGHLIGDNPLRPHGRNRGWSGFTFDTYTVKAREDFSVLPGDAVLPTYSTYVRESQKDDSGVETIVYDRFGRVPPGGCVEVSDTPVLTKHGREGQPVGTLPGGRKVNRIKVYVLA